MAILAFLLDEVVVLTTPLLLFLLLMKTADVVAVSAAIIVTIRARAIMMGMYIAEEISGRLILSFNRPTATSKV